VDNLSLFPTLTAGFLCTGPIRPQRTISVISPDQATPNQSEILLPKCLDQLPSLPDAQGTIKDRKIDSGFTERLQTFTTAFC
jgi:hypothetical protein